MIFKKSPLSGSAITSTGKLLEFTDGYYETEDEIEIAFLKGFPCYTEVNAREGEAAAPKQQAAKVGSINTAAILK